MKAILKSMMVTLGVLLSLNTHAYDALVNGIYYNLNTTEKTATVTYGSTKYTGAVSVPSSFYYNGNKYTVTSIGWNAFKSCNGLTSVSIPNGVTTIGDDAFYDCYGLTSVTIPNSVTTIGIAAFEGCGLTSVTIPNSVTSIGSLAFMNNMGLTSITIPNSVTSIGRGAFENCSSLASVAIPSSVTSIDSKVFRDCSSLTSVTIPNCVISIGYEAFFGCIGLTSVAIPSSVTSIGGSAFQNCHNLTTITIPNSVTSIGQSAFSACWGLTSVTIPSSVTSIDIDAFQGCSGLTSITIPSSVTSIGRSAFGSCRGLTSIIVESENSYYDSRNDCNAIIEKSSNTLIAGCQNTTIPSSVTTIGEFAFYNCRDLTTITIPKNVTSIGDQAFYNCRDLTTITIPKNVTSIGDHAFYGCSGLTSITVESGNSYYDSRNDCNAIIEKNSNTLIAGCQNTTIPSSVTSIGEYAFSGCGSLTTIIIPNSVARIGKSAFSGCSGLTSVVSEIEDPFAFESFAFSSISSDCVLTVPYGTKDAYIAAGWTEDVFKGGIVEAPASSSLASDNYFSISDAEAYIGRAFTLPVDMNNTEDITAFQFEVSLPNGITLSKCELTERKGDHTVSFSKLANGNYQVTALSLSSESFSGTEGTLVNLALNVDGEMATGEYAVSIKNIELTTTGAVGINPADVTATLTVSDVQIADANGDGKISITDAVSVVNFILGNASANFVNAAADVNGDGKITITDAVAIVNIILSQSGGNARMREVTVELDPQ